MFTRPKALAFISLLVGGLAVETSSLATGDYENFDLPKPVSIAPESKLVYSSPRVQLRGKGVRIKEAGVNHQQFLFAKEAYISERRDEAIKLLRQEMDSGFKKNRDNMLLRLGQLYTERYMELSYRENEVYNQKLVEYEKERQTNKQAKPPVLDNKRSHRYLKLALDIFISLEKEFPKHPKMDEVTFFIGFVKMEFGEREKGVKYLERLTRQFPHSRKYEDALVYLGDYYFDNQKFKEAQAKFQILAARKDSSLHYYGLYKIAWCELNLGKDRKALQTMKGVVAGLSGSSEVAKFNLRDQALKDLVVFFGENEAVDESVKYFTEAVGRDKARENLKLIAEMLLSRAKDKAAIHAYNILLNEFGETVDAPRLELALFESQARIGKTKEAISGLMRAIEKYGPHSQWASSMPADKTGQVKEIHEVLVNEGKKTAFFYHHAAQKSLNKTYYDLALKVYKALLTHFDDFNERRKVAFYLGEIYFAQQKWLEAASAYSDLAKIAPKDNLSEDAAYNALLAYDRLTARQDSVKRYNKDEQKDISTAEEEIPDAEKRFLEVAELYIRDYPKSTKVV
ncbi:MAG: tetratricopeptide repeat protein, partial [Deltaproteobacteria bacterium]|nr:tetratricopeptide repeat protein [Deltaproteobacteria bacterium]